MKPIFKSGIFKTDLKIDSKLSLSSALSAAAGVYGLGTLFGR